MRTQCSELESIAQKKGRRNQSRRKLKEGYEADLGKLREELKEHGDENETLRADRDDKQAKLADIQTQIKEMKQLVDSLVAAKEGLNKYVEGHAKYDLTLTYI